MTIKENYESQIWTCVKAFCPICYRTFTGWYCPTCGLPKKNSKYGLNRHGWLVSCGNYHFRPEFTSFEDFQLCSECCATNPYKAKYCRNCGKKLALQATDKNGHGWVDLGLSVLWSTEDLMWNYSWMRDYDAKYDYNYYKKQGKSVDSASYAWGEKWRMPTLDEFIELIEKCVWEKVLITEPRHSLLYNLYRPVPNRYRALKITGPNGNHIIIILTNRAGTGRAYWTATEFVNDKDLDNYSIYATHANKKHLIRREGRAPRLSCFCHSKESDDEWIAEPFDKIKSININMFPMEYAQGVRPVADKKWQGKL